MKELTTYDNLLNPELVFVVFDLETTGLSPSLDRIVEIGAVKYQDGKILDRFSTMVDPLMKIPAEASAINGITQAMVDGQPTIETALPQFLNFAKGTILVAHNAAFDVGFVRNSMARVGLGLLQNDFLDTKAMAQKALPGRKSYALQNLAADLGIKALEAHRAVDDSRVCQEVFVHCLKLLNPGGQASFF